eukprot:3846265-Rhodomonas_salina.2
MLKCSCFMLLPTLCRLLRYTATERLRCCYYMLLCSYCMMLLRVCYAPTASSYGMLLHSTRMILRFRYTICGTEIAYAPTQYEGMLASSSTDSAKVRDQMPQTTRVVRFVRRKCHYAFDLALACRAVRARIGLCARYAMSGTAMASPYAMSGTDLASPYAAILVRGQDLLCGRTAPYLPTPSLRHVRY